MMSATHMNNRLLGYRIVKLAASMSVLALSTVGVQAAPAWKGVETLGNRGPAPAEQLPSFAKSQSGVTGTLNPGALSAPVLDLTLADGTTIQARLQRVAQDKQKGTQSWIGTF